MKDVCVTGAGQGLGKAITTRLIENGYRVVAVDVQAERLKELTDEFGKSIKAIVLDVSDYSHGGSDPIYSASKAGLIGLTKSCALKFSPYVRVNAVAPGIVVDTDLAKNIPQEVLALYQGRELIKTPLAPQDVANTVPFLMSDLARSYTGAVFDLNNGYHM